MTAKKLKLNEDKTECMLFGSANAIKKYEHLKKKYIYIGSNTIEIKTVVRNL